MVFSSLQFLFIFLPVVLLGYVLIKPKFANAWLLAASLYFYYAGAGKYIFLLLAVIAVSYLSGIFISKVNKKPVKIAAVAVSVTLMISAMAYFKYFDFAIANLNAIFHKSHPLTNMILPIGISFFVFQAISYVVDVYRGEEYLKNPIDMALYISFFPQLIAGPIVRFSDIREYLDAGHREVSVDNISQGIWRFSIGLCKKVILANNLGTLSDITFGAPDIATHSVLYTWLGAIAYTLQIYFDFSGYSDMAIGLGKVFGFEFKENFNYPYAASSVKDFWRRWHISLSQFFRDYVYIPMGGNRCKRVRWIFNMAVVWILTGFWHGASWTYVLWGVIYGAIIIIETIILGKSGLVKTEPEKAGPDKDRPNRANQVFSRIYTILAVIVLWVLFRSESISGAGAYLKNMIGIGSKSFIDGGFIFLLKNYLLIIAAAIVFSLPVVPWIKKKVGENKLFKAVSAVLLAAGVIVCVSYIYMGSYNPFLYFMF